MPDLNGLATPAHSGSAGTIRPREFALRTSAALRSASSTSDSREVWRALGAHGLLADTRSENLAEFIAVLDAHCPVGVVLAHCVQVAIALPMLREQLRQRVGGVVAAAYESTVRGESMLAVAATDRDGGGSDLMSLGTTASLMADQLSLDGAKQWITNAGTADYALVLARHRPQRHFTSFLWVLVPMDARGVHVTRVESPLLAGSGVGNLRLDDVIVTREHVVGRPGRGLAMFARHVATERLVGGLWARAMCRRVLTETHRQLTVRPLGTVALWDNAAIRERFARCLVELWRIDAACAFYQDSNNSVVASMLLKTAVADSLDVVLTECARLVGAEAFVEGGLAQLRAAAGMFATAGGATGAMLAGLADHVTELLQ